MKSIVLIAIAILVFTSAASLWAATEDGDVYMAGYLLLRMRCPAGDQDVGERAAIIQQRVNDLLTSDGLDLSTIKAVKTGSEAAVYAGGRLVVTVDKCTAQANQATPMELAQIWAKRLRDMYPKAAPKPTQ